MKMPPVPTLAQDSVPSWAARLVAFLKSVVREIETPGPKVIQLEHMIDVSSATQDGLLMWSPAAGCPVVSKNGQWYTLPVGTPIVLLKSGAGR